MSCADFRLARESIDFMATVFAQLSRRCVGYAAPTAALFCVSSGFLSTFSLASPSIATVIPLQPEQASSDHFRTEEAVEPSDADAIERIVMARNSCKSFQKGTMIPEDVLKKILALTLVSGDDDALSSNVVIVFDASCRGHRQRMECRRMSVLLCKTRKRRPNWHPQCGR